MKTLVQIDFSSEKQQSDFSKWFLKEGFDLFLKSKFNAPINGGVSCLSTDEKMEWGHLFEMD